jgi:5-methylthioribose kinase
VITHSTPAVDFIVEFARANQLFPDGADVVGSEIGDGNVNYVYRLADTRTGRSVVVKLAMPYFRCAGEQYPLSIERTTREVDALELQNRYAPGLVPRVTRRFDSQGIFVMEDLSALRVMRHEMLRRVKHPHFAEQIATFMASMAFFTSDLAAVDGEKKQLETRFVNPELCKIQEDLIFTDPYYDCERNVVNPLLRPYLESVFWKHEDVRLEASRYKYKYMTNRESLLHGDLHTGSIFVDHERTVVFDPEFCFFGPTAFDIGKLMGNLAINYFCWARRAVGAAEREDYRSYLIGLMSEIFARFQEQFVGHWERSARNALANVPGYRRQFMRSLFVDMIAYWAIVMIRRTHGLARNVDVEGIADVAERADVQIAILHAAAHLLRTRNEFTNITDVLACMKQLAP